MNESPDYPFRQPAAFFPAGKQELIWGLPTLLCSWLVCNGVFFAGFHLGFAVFCGLGIVCSTLYLCRQGHRLTPYTATLLGLSLVICASFARSDDTFVKFVMFCFLTFSTNLALCLLAGQNRRAPGSISSVWDVPRTVFLFGLGKLPAAFRGILQGFRGSGTMGKKSGAILLGAVISLPLLAIVIPLLISADAAFDALLQLLPDWDLLELLVSLFTGSCLAVFLYTRSTALHHAPKAEPARKAGRGIPVLTVNTVLTVIGIVYTAYLASQLAYFCGGFSGILPEGFSLAEYARRGFFELAWLCGINLCILALGVGLVAKKDRAPLSTRLLCLFIGVATLFLVVSASAKMFLYIDAYGLTRLRVLTQVVIFFLGITTVLVCTWLFVPKLPYMKAVLVTALVIGAAVAWADVDTVVARYNVTAYQSGKLETIDMAHLDSLGYSAAPYIALLKNEADPYVAETAREMLSHTYHDAPEAFRGWNYVNHIAKEYFPLPGDLAIPKHEG